MRYEDLERLNNLREKGAISEEEYQREKEKILNRPDIHYRQELFGMEENTYCMFIHLSQLLGMVVPLAGLIVPIILWATNKDRSAMVDRQGRVVMNWIISSIIYTSVFGLPCIVLIGIPLLIAFLIMDFIFIIIGAVKANSGEVWQYPLSFKFLPVG